MEVHQHLQLPLLASSSVFCWWCDSNIMCIRLKRNSCWRGSAHYANVSHPCYTDRVHNLAGFSRSHVSCLITINGPHERSNDSYWDSYSNLRTLMIRQPLERAAILTSSNVAGSDSLCSTRTLCIELLLDMFFSSTSCTRSSPFLYRVSVHGYCVVHGRISALRLMIANIILKPFIWSCELNWAELFERCVQFKCLWWRSLDSACQSHRDEKQSGPEQN